MGPDSRRDEERGDSGDEEGTRKVKFSGFQEAGRGDGGSLGNGIRGEDDSEEEEEEDEEPREENNGSSDAGSEESQSIHRGETNNEATGEQEENGSKHVCFAPAKEVFNANNSVAKQVVPVTLGANNKLNNVDDILEALGGFGWFQLLILVLLLGFEIPTAFLVFVPVFIGATPPFWLCDNETIPKTEACSCEGILSPVDPTVSIVAEWNLMCNTSWVSDTIVSLQMFGMMFGTMIVAQLSDWYGRKYVFVAMTFQMMAGSALTALAPNAYIYAVARFFCGGAFAGFLSTTAIYSMEFLTPKWRQLSSVGPFGEGTMLLGIIAYYIRPWRTLVGVTTLPLFLIIIVFPFVPESPRWLLRNQKLDECYRALKYIARINGKEPIDMETLELIAENEKPKDANGVVTSNKVERFSYLEFCRDPDLRRTTLYLQGIWFMWALVYFGISYNMKNLAGNPYLNVFFMGMVDALGYPTSFLVNSRIGRRKALLVFMSITALFLVAIAILQLTINLDHTLRAVLCLIAKFGTAGARSAVRTLTGESFPTSVRSMGIGMASITASIGAAVSPQLAYIGAYWPPVPFFIFAIMSVAGALISFLLAETSGKPLQEVHTKALRVTTVPKETKKIKKESRAPKRNDKHNRVRPSAKYGVRTSHFGEEEE